MRLLVVDDDAVFREELGDLLTQDGHQAVTSPSVRKAIEQLESQDFDVIFTDLKMPRQSGLDLLREVRHRWPRTLVVMITGFATVDTAVEAMKEGAFDYIRKPFHVTQVQETLNLAEQELRFGGPRSSTSNPDSLVEVWIHEEHREVLELTARSVRSQAHLMVYPLNSSDLSQIRDLIDSFLATNPRVAILIEGAESLLRQHRREDVIALMGDLRGRVQGHGPLVVTFDPLQTSAADVADLRAALVAPGTRSTLEALANPIRRAVLRRVAQGPCAFMDAMQAAGLEESPKLSFHLRKLVEEGLIVHVEEAYRISSLGKEAVRLLEEVDALSSSVRAGNAVVPAAPRE